MNMLLIKLVLQNMFFIGLHFDGKNKFPRQLSPKEEAECLRLAAEGNKEARDKLVIHNLRLVAYIVAKKYSDCKEADDLVSIGTIGLIRASETFDCSQNIRFSTYASRCIDNQIKMHFRKMKHRMTEVYINEPMESDAEGNALTIADILSSGIDIARDVELKIDTEKLYAAIESELDDRERTIICKRYGVSAPDGSVCKPMTQREIAKEMGISRSYISRIEKRALEKLRSQFE